MQNNFQVIADDSSLQPFRQTFHQIHDQYHNILKLYDQKEGGILKFSEGYHRFGIHQENDQIVYREWAPMAQQIHLYGQFNNWEPFQHKANKDEYGNWELRIKGNIKPYTVVKAKVKLSDGTIEDRVPAWITFVRQNEYTTFQGVYCPSNYQFKHENPQWENNSLKIYECHVGMSGIEAKIYTYKHFRENIIDRIVNLGYNAIQLMAIAEHPYYGSFGYHVSSFFAPSSRCGTPDQLKQLIDYAHSKNLKVLMDLVHAHAVKNTVEGLNMWDGTDYQYFHAFPQGYHTAWDSRIFDYGKYQVQRFLLSNIKYWMVEYRIDGFRFDGITSMLYKHHGINYGFTGDNNEYFGEYLDRDALVYIMLANNVIKNINPKSITIAQDVSGFPGLCRTIDQGGFGFDYRLAMGIPDMWYRLIREVSDQNWKMSEIARQLSNRRCKQKTIAYSESHDQAFVGDKTIAQWLFDNDIFTEMSTQKQETIKVFRGMALHKMIRLVTISLGGEGYLNFMGNQFGHPEWIDFPRDGNGWSHEHCRRRWDLADNKNLRFHFLQNFDKAMIGLQFGHHFMSAMHIYVSLKHDEDHVLVYQKNNLLFVFNFHPTQSYQNYLIPCQYKGTLDVVLDTDRADFGGHSRIQNRQYHTEPNPWCDRQNSFKLYLPSRSAVVFVVRE